MLVHNDCNPCSHSVVAKVRNDFCAVTKRSHIFGVFFVVVFITTYRAAIVYKRKSRVLKKPTCLVALTGRDLIGLPLSSPLTSNSTIYTLPMLTVLTDKGAGIVTCVPSNSQMISWL